MNKKHINSIKQMQLDWDEIALQNAFFGVDSSPEFEDSKQISEELFWKKGEEVVNQFLQKLNMGDTSNWSMVEIGCGLGRMTHIFAQKFSKVFAFDVSSEMLKRAQLYWSNIPNIEFILGSGRDLKPVADDSVEFVFSFIVLQHVLDPEIVLNYLRETGRVLRTDGVGFLQFRTFTPDPVPVITPWNKAMLLIPLPIKRFLKNIFMQNSITKKRISPGVSSASQNLEQSFNSRYLSWHGCWVNPSDVEKTIKANNLEIVGVSGINSQYTFYTFKKI